MSHRTYIVTGAAGHLGGGIVRELIDQGKTVRAFIMPGESCVPEAAEDAPITRIEGDVCDSASLDRLFDGCQDDDIIVIHCAGIISITKQMNPKIWAVNVDGTKNIIDACVRHRALRLVYVSSVHALPVLPWGHTMSEVTRFDPDSVPGAYAKTKARASQLVLDATREAGLDAVIIHPAGIIGPMASDNGNVNNMIFKFLAGKLGVAVHGGYDFVDVRDVASGAIAAAERGTSGECYVLSNRFIDTRELFGALSDAAERRPLKTYVPMWMARAAAPFAELYYRVTHKVPMFTRYSLFTLSENSIFSHEKATRDLGYRPRDFKETINDTVSWVRRSMLPSSETKPRKRRHVRKTSNT